jgi:RNA polymerase sigma factor (sigma-70 family)
MSEDVELLRQYAENRSEAAFAELVRRHVNLVYGAALRRVGGDTHLAEEVTQTVFTTLARKAGRLVRHPLLAGWLHRSTRYAALDSLRDKLRQDQAVKTMNANADPSRNQGPEINWAEIRPLIDTLLDQLNEHDRGALLLRFFENRTFAEIGATMRLSEGAARMRVERALYKVYVRLGRRGIKSTTAALASVLVAEAATVAPAGLAGAALTTSSSVIGVFAFMSTTKMIVAIIGAVALMGTLGYVIGNRASPQRTPLLQAAPFRASEQRPSNSGDELSRLQAENTALKRVRADLETRLARRPQSPVSGNVPEGMKPISAWKNAGRATPETAIGTLLWAMSSQDVDTLASMMALTPEARQKAEALFAGLPQATQDEFGSPNKLLATLFIGDTLSEPVPTGVQVLGPKDQGTNDTEMRTLIAFSDGTTKTVDYPLQLQGDGGWSAKIVPGLVDRWARTIGGNPTVPDDAKR